MYHNILPRTYFFNNNTLNVFTDASISKFNGVWVGAPGAHVYKGDKFFAKKIKCIYDFTVNESELEGIYIGLQLAMNIASLDSGNPYKINIISDSMISIKGLTEWVFQWYKTCKNGIWFNYNGEPVTNQYLYMQIIDTIIKYKPRIHFYHVRGHFDNCVTSTGINMDKISKLEEFKNSFSKANGFVNSTTIDNETARFLIIANNAIDEETRQSINNPNIWYLHKLKAFPRFVDNPFTDQEMRTYRDIIQYS